MISNFHIEICEGVAPKKHVREKHVIKQLQEQEKLKTQPRPMIGSYLCFVWYSILEKTVSSYFQVDNL